MRPKCTGPKGHLQEPDEPSGDATDTQWHDQCFEPIKRAVTTVARRFQLQTHEAEELQSDLWVKVLTRRGHVLRRFRGDASIQTYLTSVAQNLVRDRRNKDWGKWRPSVAARRHGPEAMALEKLIRRDGLSFDDAVASLRRAGRLGASDGLREIAANFPHRRSRRVISVKALDDIPAPDSPATATSYSFEQVRQQSRVKRALRLSLQELTRDDRTLIARRYGHAMTVTQISAVFGGDPKLMYRQLARILSTLRKRLLALGVDTSIVKALLENREADLELNLKSLSCWQASAHSLVQEAS
jgi:RNA polymerase sigma factor (sigma-70 family)